MDSRFFRGAFFLVLVGGFFLLIFAIRSSEPRRQDNPGQWREAEEDVHLEGVHFREWNKGTLLWDLDARIAKYFHEDEKAFFQNVSMTFHPPEGGRSMTLHADRVFYEMNHKKLMAEGNVWGEGEQGFRFYTDSLIYHVDDKTVESPDKVVLKKDRLIVEGIGMKGSLADQTFMLLSSVRTVFGFGQGVQ